MNTAWSKQEYEEWLLTRSNEMYEIRKEEERIVYDAGEHKAYVSYYPDEIMELMILNSEGNNEFYLHFRLADREHAQELTEDMLRALLKLTQKKQVKILLFCTGGMTTSYFAMRMNEAAKVLDLDYHCDAVAYEHVFEEGINYDVILLAPQVAHRYKQIKEIMKDQLVLKMPPAVFGRYAAGDMLRTVQEELRKKRDEGIPEEIMDLKEIQRNDYRILTIGLINHNDASRFAYRIYDHGRKTLDKEVIKPSITPADIDDLLDYIAVRHKNLDLIGIAIPGITNRGRVDYASHGFEKMNLAEHIYEKYGMSAVILNDVNAMTLGYHALHENCDNMSFLFQPREGGIPGTGMMIDGKLHRGFGHNAGEIGTMIRRLYPKRDQMICTPEGAMELVSTAIHLAICTYAPDKVVVYSELTPDMDEIRECLKKEIRAEYIPELVHVRRVKRYILPGTLVRCLELLHKTNGEIVDRVASAHYFAEN